MTVLEIYYGIPPTAAAGDDGYVNINASDLILTSSGIYITGLFLGVPILCIIIFKLAITVLIILIR